MNRWSVVFVFICAAASFSFAEKVSAASCIVPAVSAPDRQACGVCAGTWTKYRLKMWGLTQEDKIRRRQEAFRGLYSDREWILNRCELNTVTRPPTYKELLKENEALRDEIHQLQDK